LVFVAPIKGRTLKAFGVFLIVPRDAFPFSKRYGETLRS
jgi:hypothetical protein